jgi:Tfp pilus assembly protein PilF
VRRASLLLLLAWAACATTAPSYVPDGGRLARPDLEAWQEARDAATRGERARAIRILESVSARSPAHIPTRIWLQDLRIEEDGREAVRRRARVLADSREGDWIARLLVLRLEPDPAKRLAAYERLLATVPGEPWVHLAVADAAIELSGHLDEVAARAADPRDGDRRELLRARRESEAARREAERAVRAALARDPLLVPALRRRADLLGMEAEREEDPDRRTKLDRQCLEAYDEALALAPDDVPSLVARAAVHRRLHDYGAARGDLERAAEVRPRDADLHHNLGVLAYEMADLSGAESSFRRAASLSPGSADVLRNLGDVLASREKWEDAGDVYRKALALAPEDPSLLERLGNLHLQLGERKQALAYYRRYLATDGPDRARVEAAMRRAEGRGR